MAAPHVTAAAALYKASRPTATPSQVRRALRAFGNHDWKTATRPGRHARAAARRRAHRPAGRLRDGGAVAVDGPRSGGRHGQDPRRGDPRRERPGPDQPLGRRRLAARAPRSPTPLLSGFSDSTSQLTVSVPAGTGTGPTSSTSPARSAAPRTRPGWRSWSTPLAPTLGRPWLGIRSSNVASGGRFTARAGWPAGKDTTTAIGGYQVRWSVDGGPWGSQGPVGSGPRSSRPRVRRRPQLSRPGSGPRRRRQLERLEPGRPVRGRPRPGQQHQPLEVGHLARRRAPGSWAGGTTRYTKAPGRLDRPLVHGQGDRAGRAHGPEARRRPRLHRRQPRDARSTSAPSTCIRAGSCSRATWKATGDPLDPGRGPRHAAPPPGRRGRVRHPPVARGASIASRAVAIEW